MANSEITPASYDAASTGATIRASYVSREMTYYAVDRREINSIATMTTLTLVFCSTGSFFLSLSIGLLLGRLYADHVTALGEFLATFGVGVSLFLAVVFFLLGAIVYIKRRREITEILDGPSTTATVSVKANAI